MENYARKGKEIENIRQLNNINPVNSKNYLSADKDLLVTYESFMSVCCERQQEETGIQDILKYQMRPKTLKTKNPMLSQNNFYFRHPSINVALRDENVLQFKKESDVDKDQSLSQNVLSYSEDQPDDCNNQEIVKNDLLTKKEEICLEEIGAQQIGKDQFNQNQEQQEYLNRNKYKNINKNLTMDYKQNGQKQHQVEMNFSKPNGDLNLKEQFARNIKAKSLKSALANSRLSKYSQRSRKDLNYSKQSSRVSHNVSFSPKKKVKKYKPNTKIKSKKLALEVAQYKKQILSASGQWVNGQGEGEGQQGNQQKGFTTANNNQIFTDQQNLQNQQNFIDQQNLENKKWNYMNQRGKSQGWKQ